MLKNMTMNNLYIRSQDGFCLTNDLNLTINKTKSATGYIFRIENTHNILGVYGNLSKAMEVMKDIETGINDGFAIYHMPPDCEVGK